jgi:hypothetical protein
VSCVEIEKVECYLYRCWKENAIIALTSIMPAVRKG